LNTGVFSVPHCSATLIASSRSLGSMVANMRSKPFMNKYSSAVTSQMAYALLSCSTMKRYRPSGVNAAPSGSASSATSSEEGPYRRTPSARNVAASVKAPSAKLSAVKGYVVQVKVGTPPGTVTSHMVIPPWKSWEPSSAAEPSLMQAMRVLPSEAMPSGLLPASAQPRNRKVLAS